MSCSQDITKDMACVLSPIKEFKVGFEEPNARIQLNDVMQTVWNTGDAVSVFNKNSANGHWKFVGENLSTNGKISHISTPSGGFVYDKVYAIYPYSASNTMNRSKKILTSVPAIQKYRENSFGKGGNIMVAVCENEDELKFSHLFGWICLPLTGTMDISKIVLEGNNDEILAGNIYVDPETLECVFSGNESTIITLDCDSGVELSSNEITNFYIAVPPQTFSKGFTASIYNGDDIITKYQWTKSNVEIARNHIVTTSVIDYNTVDIPSNEIWYTSHLNSIVEIKDDPAVVGHYLKDGKGVIVFSEKAKVYDEMFYNNDRITSITLPNSITHIGNSAFYGCIELKSITLPDSLTSIGNTAFYNCRNLTSINIPKNVTTIEQGAFSRCSNLRNIRICDGVTSIQDAFSYCDNIVNVSVKISNLTAFCTDNIFHKIPGNKYLYINGQEIEELTIPSDVTSIGDYAFYGCSHIEKIIIPNSVVSIGKSAFVHCSSVNNIILSEDLLSIGYGAFMRCDSLTDLTIPNSVVQIGGCAFFSCDKLARVNIGKNISSIESEAFEDCPNLKDVYYEGDLSSWCKISFGNGGNPLCNGAKLYIKNLEVSTISVMPDITEIKKYAFNGCTSLTSISIPDNVITIGYGSFADCNNLTNISIPNSITQIDGSAFRGCSGKLDINSKIVEEYYNTKDYECWLYGANFSEITIGDNINSIGQRAFDGFTSLKNVEIHDNLRQISNAAFRNCSSLESINLPNSITSIGYSAFEGCSMIKSLCIPNNLATIERKTFYNCNSIENLNIPDSVTSIGENAFYGCSHIAFMDIGCGLKTIGSYAFHNCSRLAIVYCQTIIPPYCSSVIFNGVSSSLKIYVPTQAVALYEADYRWGKYNIAGDGEYINPLLMLRYTTSDNNIITPNLDEEIISNTYTNDGGCIILGTALIEIPPKAFEGCENLTNITIPESVTSIGDFAFANCASLKNITIPKNVASIGIGVFHNCDNLHSFNGKFASEDNCSLVVNGILKALITTNLTEYHVPEFITGIESYTFYNCTTLTNIVIPDSVVYIGSYAFLNCTALSNIDMPNKIETIEDRTFCNCSSLTNINLPDSTHTIGDAAFENCTNLTSITIPGNVYSIGDSAFGGCSNLINVYCKPISPPSIYYQKRIDGIAPKRGSFPFNQNLKIYVSSYAYNYYIQYSTPSYGRCVKDNWCVYESYLKISNL